MSHGCPGRAVSQSRDATSGETDYQDEVLPTWVREQRSLPVRQRAAGGFVDAALALTGDPLEVLNAVHLEEQLTVFDRPLGCRRDEQRKTGMQQVSMFADVPQGEPMHGRWHQRMRCRVGRRDLVLGRVEL